MITIPEHKTFAIINNYPGIAGPAFIFVENGKILVWNPSFNTPISENILHPIHDYLIISLLETSFKMVRQTLLPLVKSDFSEMTWKNLDTDMLTLPLGLADRPPVDFLYFNEFASFNLNSVDSFKILRVGEENIISFVTNPYQFLVNPDRYNNNTIILISPNSPNYYDYLLSNITYDDDTLFFFDFSNKYTTQDLEACLDFIIYLNNNNINQLSLEPKLILRYIPSEKPFKKYLIPMGKPKSSHKITFLTFIEDFKGFDNEDIILVEVKDPVANQTTKAAEFTMTYNSLQHIVYTCKNYLNLTSVNFTL